MWERQETASTSMLVRQGNNKGNMFVRAKGARSPKAHRVLEEQDLSIIRGKHDVTHTIIVDVMQQGRGVRVAAVVGRPADRLRAIRPL